MVHRGGLPGKALPGALHSAHCGYASGYANGVKPHPTNQEVHTGLTNHAKVVRLVFDPNRVSSRPSCASFFETHDPTAATEQGPGDIGAEHRRGIYCTTPPPPQQPAPESSCGSAS